MHYFVQGLRDDIKREVVEQKPIDYQTAENMARLKVSVDKTIADNITKDPGKDIFYKLLDKLAPQPTKSTGSEKEPKIAAMQPANRFTNDLSAKFQKLRAELRQELREEMRSLRESLICPQESQESQFSPVFSPPPLGTKCQWFIL